MQKADVIQTLLLLALFIVMLILKAANIGGW
jgi:hypothetical protein